MALNIFLDDERIPGDVVWVTLPNVMWSVVRNFEQFKSVIDELDKAPDFISFDHDLADEHYTAMLLESVNSTRFVGYGTEKTGYECAKYLVEVAMNKGWQMPGYAVHSMNAIGAKRIRDYLENAKKFMEEDGA